MVTDRLAQLISAALERAVADGVVELGEQPSIRFERPKRSEHGDWSSNVALVAGRTKGKPRDFAQALVERLPDSDLVARVEVAGPGFINFHLSPAWLHDVVRRAADPRASFARTDRGRGTKVNVEYVSANPTGPINVVSGRHAAIGDAVSNLLEATGHEVTREFYVNDAGRQMWLFAASLGVRYLQHFGIEAELPEDGYRGDYVTEMASDIAEEIGVKLVDAPEGERIQYMREIGLPRMLDQMSVSLERFGTRFDVWTSEATVHDDGCVEKAVSRLRESGLVAERDGAVWFLASRLGDDKDRVLIRASGAPTYLASDAGYLLDKFSRGFHHLIYLWGADHHGTVARVLAAAEALGFSRSQVEISLVQIVTLLHEGEAVRSSKRAGAVVELNELLDQVGADAARYTFLTRSIDAPLDFDIALAREQAPENPVYYVQYAHARISSILKKAGERGLDVEAAWADLARCEHPAEEQLMRKLASYEEVVPEAAELRAPQRITRFVEELASLFSAFYRDCRVISDDAELSRARLALCVATKSVIADALGLLGVNAPERM